MNRQPVIDDRSRSPYRWLIFGSAALVYLLVFSQRTMPGLISLSIMRDFRISASVLGMVSGIQFFGYMLLQVPVGVMGDGFGPEPFLFLGALLDGLGTVIFALAPNVGFLFLARAMVGIGDAMIWVNLVLFLGNWFRPREYMTTLALSSAAGNTGAILAMVPVSVWLAHTNWRVPFAVTGCLLLLAAGIMKTVAAKVPERLRVEKHNRFSAAFAGRAMRTAGGIVANRNIWPLFAGHFAVVGTNTGFLGAWAVPYLMITYRMTRPAAGAMLTVVLVGSLLGAPAASMVGRLAPGDRVLYFLGNTLALLSWLALFLLHAHTRVILIYLVLFMIGLSTGTAIVTFTLVRRFFGLEANGVASGLANTGGFLGAVLLPVVFGLVLEGFAAVRGHAVYSAAAFHPAMLVPVFFALVGFVGSGLLLTWKLPDRAPEVFR